jgi:hypothetical protein
MRLTFSNELKKGYFPIYCLQIVRDKVHRQIKSHHLINESLSVVISVQIAAYRPLDASIIYARVRLRLSFQ